MIRHPALFANLARDTKGASLVEAALAFPLLAILALGGFEASNAVSRHMELQSAAAEAAAIVLSDPPTSTATRDTIEDIIEASTGLADGDVTIYWRYRCDADTTLKTSDTCPTGDIVTTYVQFDITDTYTPLWSDFGIGGDIEYAVTRRVQIS